MALEREVRRNTARRLLAMAKRGRKPGGEYSKNRQRRREEQMTLAEVEARLSKRGASRFRIRPSSCLAPIRKVNPPEPTARMRRAERRTAHENRP